MAYGTLYICGTPIGNLEDISLRVLRILRDADIIAAEDTRHTLKLLNHFEIKKQLIAYHEHNKAAAGRKLIDLLKNGKNIALVTDGGMPCISDPGGDITRLCVANGIPLTVCPGPTALITALAMSGLPTEKFIFEGFLPRGLSERRVVLSGLAGQRQTLIFYEAPHHLRKTLADLHEALGNRPAAALRELTKIYEEALRGSLSELIDYYASNEPKGEYVIIVAGMDEVEAKKRLSEQYDGISYTEHLERYTKDGADKKDAIKAVARDRGISKRQVYSGLLTEKE